MIKDPEKQSDEAFLSRWSRRKQNKAEEIEGQGEHSEGSLERSSPVTSAPVESHNLTSDRSEQAEDGSEVPVLTDADMPPIESLDENSDYSGFMSSGVSDQLRKLALRKLFAGAGFNIRDGLDDYDEDFTNFEPLGDLVTSDMKHQAEMAEKRKREAEEKEAAEQLAEESEAESEAAEEAITEVEEDTTEAEPENEVLDTNQSTVVLSEQNDSENTVDETVNAQQNPFKS